MTQTPLVVKPDCLFGKRGKHDLVGLKLDYLQAQEFVTARMNKVRVGGGAVPGRALACKPRCGRMGHPGCSAAAPGGRPTPARGAPPLAAHTARCRRPLAGGGHGWHRGQDQLLHHRAVCAARGRGGPRGLALGGKGGGGPSGEYRPATLLPVTMSTLRQPGVGCLRATMPCLSDSAHCSLLT